MKTNVIEQLNQKVKEAIADAVVAAGLSHARNFQSSFWKCRRRNRTEISHQCSHAVDEAGQEESPSNRRSDYRESEYRESLDSDQPRLQARALLTSASTEATCTRSLLEVVSKVSDMAESTAAAVSAYKSNS